MERHSYLGCVAAAGCGALTLVTSMAGCVANSSNPTVRVASSRMSAASAEIQLAIANPGGRDLTIDQVTYDLSHGEMAFPLASGAWEGVLKLPAGEASELRLDIVFDQPPLELDSGQLHLIGELHHTDHTGFLGLHSMDLGSTPFALDTDAELGAS